MPGKTILLSLLILLACDEISAQGPPARSTGAPGVVRQSNPDFSAAIADARRMADALRETAGIPGLSVAAGVGDAIVWAEGFGLADLENPSPVTTSTRFRAASVSKVLTAAALARLSSRGEVALDAPIRNYVSSFPEKEGTITLRLLSGHLGGIRHYVPSDFRHDMRHYGSLEDALPIFAQSELVAPPGTQYEYSTFGYTLLGAALEEASKTNFLTLMEREVFAPLEMRDSGGDLRRTIVPGRTSFFERGRDGALGHAAYVDPSYKWPGGGLLTTPSDLVRFGLAHLRPGFLPADLVNEMFTPQKTAAGRETGVGIGWRVGHDWRGRRILHHSGSMAGTRSSLVIYPDERVVLAFMTNLSGTPGMAEETLQMLAEPFLARTAVVAGNEEAISGIFRYGGTIEDAPAVGVLTLNNGAGSLSTPQPLSDWLRANGAPDDGLLPIVAAFQRRGSTHLVLATPFGLLPAAMERTGSGFRAVVERPRKWVIEATRVSDQTTEER